MQTAQSEVDAAMPAPAPAPEEEDEEDDEDEDLDSAPLSPGAGFARIATPRLSRILEKSTEVVLPLLS